MEATRYTWHPRYRGIVFRRTYTRLEELMDRAWQWYPGLGGRCRDGRDWVFPSGAKVLFRHCQNEEDKRAYHGHEYHFMAFDQLEEFTESQYTFLLGQNRTGVAELEPYTRSTFNPGGVGHGWVKARFVEHGTRDCAPWTPHNDAGVALQPRCFHFATIDDNPAGELADPTYRQRLQNLPEADRRALLEGDWDVFAGQFFGEWRRELHTCPPFNLPKHWTTRGWSCDWGYGAPWSVHFWVRDEDLYKAHRLERWYAYREFYRTKLADEDQARLIGEAIDDDEASSPYPLEWSAVMDPSCWNLKPNSQVSVASVYGGEPFNLLMRRANNDRKQGWAQLRRFLKVTDVDKRPLLIFMRDRCPKAIATIPTLIFDPVKVEETLQAPQVEDHSADEVRYWLMSRGRPSDALLTNPIGISVGDDDDEEKTSDLMLELLAGSE